MKPNNTAYVTHSKIPNALYVEAEQRDTYTGENKVVYDPNIGKMYPERIKDVLPYDVRMAIKQNDNMNY